MGNHQRAGVSAAVKHLTPIAWVTQPETLFSKSICYGYCIHCWFQTSCYYLAAAFGLLDTTIIIYVV